MGPIDLRVCRAAIVLGAFKGQTAEAALDVEASLIDGTIMDTSHTLVNVCRERPRGSVVWAKATKTTPTLANCVLTSCPSVGAASGARSVDQTRRVTRTLAYPLSLEWGYARRADTV